MPLVRSPKRAFALACALGAGVSFLLGLVTPAEANAAVEIARTTGGVQKVVRVFEVISPEQARALDNSGQPAQAPVQDAKTAPKK